MPVSMSFPLPFSMYGAIEDALRLSWAVRKKPLESFLLPAAAVSLPGGAGVLVCRDGSLVSLFRLDGARSMMGARELDGFVELAARRLNSVFTAPGHALHAVFERAPDEAARLVASAGGADASAMRAARARAGRRDRRARPPPRAADGSREFRYGCLDPPGRVAARPVETRP